MTGLLPGKPFRHLFDVAFFIASSVGRLRKINVKSLGTFSAVSICGPTGDDGGDIMLHGVEFRYVEIVSTLPNAFIRKVMQVVMEGNPCFFKLAKGISSVGLKVCIVNEVQSGPYDPY